MKPVPLFALSPADQTRLVIPAAPRLHTRALRSLDLFTRRRLASSARALSISLAGAAAYAAFFGVISVQAADGTNSTGASVVEVQNLQEQIAVLQESFRKVQAELANIKASSEQNVAKLTSNAQGNVKQEDLDALKDIVDEQLLRDVGTRTSSTAKGSSFITLGGGGIFRFADLVGKNYNFSVPSASLSLSGPLRNDPATDGNVSYAVGLLGATGSDTASSLSLSDLYLQWDIKTAKLELEPAYTLSLKAGQQLVPFGLDNINGELARPTIYTGQYLAGIPTASGQTFG